MVVCKVIVQLSKLEVEKVFFINIIIITIKFETTN